MGWRVKGCLPRKICRFVWKKEKWKSRLKKVIFRLPKISWKFEADFKNFENKLNVSRLDDFNEVSDSIEGQGVAFF